RSSTSASGSSPCSSTRPASRPAPSPGCSSSRELPSFSPVRSGCAGSGELLELLLDVVPEQHAVFALFVAVPAEEDHRDHRPQIEAPSELHDQARHLHVTEGADPV